MKKNYVFLSGFILLLALTLWFYPQLPEEIPVHWNAVGEIDRYGGKIHIFIACGIYLLGWIFIPLCERIDPKKNNYPRFRKVLTLIQALVCLLAVVILAITLLACYSPHPINISMILVLFISLMFIFLGNSMPKIKANYMIGIRTPWTIADERVWYKTHRLGGKLWFIGGFLMLFSILLPSKWLIAILISVVIVISVIPLLYSYLYFRKLQKENADMLKAHETAYRDTQTDMGEARRDEEKRE